MGDLGIQQFKEQLLTEIQGMICTAVLPLIQRLDTISQKVDALDEKVDALDEKVNALDGKVDALRTKQEQMDVLQRNSLRARHEALIEVPNANGVLPRAEGVDFPQSLNQLLVAGNERLPVTNEVNDWNKKKSRQLLLFYGATGGYDSETENEYTPTARSARFQLAKVLGVSSVQLQQAAASLAGF
jgi:outer membrane murein-binding lipoprotein Lpp